MVTLVLGGRLVEPGRSHHRRHDLRHTCASLLRVQRADITHIQWAFGHSTISIAPDVYTRMRGGERREIAGRMDEALGT